MDLLVMSHLGKLIFVPTFEIFLALRMHHHIFHIIEQVLLVWVHYNLLVNLVATRVLFHIWQLWIPHGPRLLLLRRVWVGLSLIQEARRVDAHAGVGLTHHRLVDYPNTLVQGQGVHVLLFCFWFVSSNLAVQVGLKSWLSHDTVVVVQGLVA